jgi:lipoprotein-releasing system permease protein
MQQAGWELRRLKAALSRPVEVPEEELAADPFRRHLMVTQAAAPAELKMPDNPYGPTAQVGQDFDPAREQHIGCVLGMALCTYRKGDGAEQFLALPGDDVELTYPSAGRPPRPLSAKFTITDFYESKMQEFDAGFVFVPIRELQELRNMIDPQSGVANFNTIQIRLKPGVDLNFVRDLLRENFPAEMFAINTWRDKQGPLLAAVQLETIILNILLFLIILVAGFGILATFFMIVVEKTRDIGVLKSLGASASGVLGIFLGYGLSLGTFGASVGVMMGLLFVRYIDRIADGVSYMTGQPVFDPSIYSFHRIPTIVEPFTVSWIVLGAILIAVVASILPAWRAARLHPVKALRYE